METFAEVICFDFPPEKKNIINKQISHVLPLVSEETAKLFHSVLNVLMYCMLRTVSITYRFVPICV